MISTHVLDTEEGAPGVGINVSLYRGQELISHQETDADGRIQDLSEGKVLDAGEYRLVFHVASGFFERIEVTIVISDPSAHYHVPLLLAPYSCTVYRGS
jgi:5-hydroxyisourate hydrolase